MVQQCVFFLSKLVRDGPGPQTHRGGLPQLSQSPKLVLRQDGQDSFLEAENATLLEETKGYSAVFIV